MEYISYEPGKTIIMKKYIINGKFLTQRQTGAQRYAREIVEKLDSLSKEGEFTIVIPKGDWTIPTYQKIKVQKVGSLQGIAWEQITLPIYALVKGYTLLNLCNVAPLLKPDYSTIFDMKIKSHPHFYGWKFKWWYEILFANQTKRCKLIFTDSEDAKSELLKYYPKAKPDKIVVAHASWEHFNKVDFDNKTLEKYNLKSKDYFFSMGSLEPNKNFRWVSEVAKKNTHATFVVAGSLNAKVFANGMGFECPQNMKLLGYVTDEEAKTLMRDAKAFLFPSFCEGFGMPPLEAMSAGVYRVIVSDIPVMHEIFKENAIYINPQKYDYQLDELLKVSRSDSDSVLERFSWADSAKIVYNRLINI